MLLKTLPKKRAKGPGLEQKDFNLDESINTLLSESEHQNESAGYFFIIEDKRFIKIRYAEIQSIEASRCYIIIHTLTNRHIVIGSMVQLEKKLPSSAFCRIHRSWIVPMDGISVISRQRIMVNENWFPLGNTFRLRLLARLSPYVFNRRFLSDLE